MKTLTIAGVTVMVQALVLPAMIHTAIADIRIAVVGPMTGPNASFGTQLVSGARIAAETINAQGGVLGEKIEIVIEDDACDPRQAVSVANKIVAEGISFVNGHFCSGSTVPASEVYEENGIVSLTVSTSPAVTERGFERIFRISGRDDQQGVVAGAFIREIAPDGRIAVVHDKSAFGAGLADVLTAYLKNNGVTPVIETGVNAGEKDFSALLARLKDLAVDVVYFGGYHTEAGLMMRQAADLGLPLELVGGDPLSSNEFVAIAADAADNAYFTFGPDPKLNPSAATAVEALKAAGAEPDGWALYSHAIIETFAKAMTQAGSADPAAVTAALKAGTFATALGDIAFDDKGDNRAPGFVIYRWRGGKAEYAAE